MTIAYRLLRTLEDHGLVVRYDAGRAPELNQVANSDGSAGAAPSQPYRGTHDDARHRPRALDHVGTAACDHGDLNALHISLRDRGSTDAAGRPAPSMSAGSGSPPASR